MVREKQNLLPANTDLNLKQTEWGVRRVSSNSETGLTEEIFLSFFPQPITPSCLHWESHPSLAWLWEIQDPKNITSQSKTWRSGSDPGVRQGVWLGVQWEDQLCRELLPHNIQLTAKLHPNLIFVFLWDGNSMLSPPRLVSKTRILFFQYLKHVNPTLKAVVFQGFPVSAKDV